MNPETCICGPYSTPNGPRPRTGIFTPDVACRQSSRIYAPSRPILCAGVDAGSPLACSRPCRRPGTCPIPYARPRCMSSRIAFTAPGQDACDPLHPTRDDSPRLPAGTRCNAMRGKDRAGILSVLCQPSGFGPARWGFRDRMHVFLKDRIHPAAGIARIYAHIHPVHASPETAQNFFFAR